ncbi:MAG TPA: hypothetical protein VFQ22_05640 [Longimicrobiales bacterium]|nr:hypothetical protein [Longimicrobiales bacterium]
MRAFVLALPPLLALSAAAAPSASAQESTSSEGALFLLLPVGAEAIALGRATTAVEGPESAFWNPAGLGALERSRFVVFRGEQVAGTATAASLLLARPGTGTIGASYLLLDGGTQELTDDSGTFLGEVSVRNHLGVISAAARVLENVTVGASFKIVQFRFTCRGQCQVPGTTATTYAFDVGMQMTPLDGLRVGAMLAHVGPALQVVNAEQADPLPQRVRIAAAYDVMRLIASTEDFRTLVLVEVQDRLRNPGVPSLYMGLEFRAGQTDALSLRTGYVISDVRDRIEGADPEDGARVGLGIRYGRIDMSIAKSLAVSTLTGETEPVHVTLSIGL